MFRGSAKGTRYPLHSPVSPSLPIPCVTVCHHISSGVYQVVVCQVSLGECKGNTECLFYRFTNRASCRVTFICGIAVGYTCHGQGGLKVHLACSYRSQTFPINWNRTAAIYRGADKSLARPRRKQANVSVRMAWISFGALPPQEKKLDDSSRLDFVDIARVSDMLPSLFPSWSGSGLHQHPSTYRPANKQSPWSSFSWEANRSSASQDFPLILWSPKVHHHFHYSPSPVPIPSRIVLIQTQPTPVLLSTSTSDFNTITLNIPLSFFVCATRLAHQIQECLIRVNSVLLKFVSWFVKPWQRHNLLLQCKWTIGMEWKMVNGINFSSVSGACCMPVMLTSVLSRE